MIPEVRSRMYTQEVGAMYGRKPIRSTIDAADALMEHFYDADKEYFVAVYLDSQGRPISFSIVSSGDVNAVHFPISSVFKTALLQNSVSIIICHNHPGGTLSPSIEDLEATRMLVEAGKMLGIKVLDHFIITPTDYLSLRERRGDLFN